VKKTLKVLDTVLQTERDIENLFVIRRLKGGESILDVGHVEGAIMRIFRHAIGLDYRTAPLAFRRQVIGDATKLPFRTRCFDAVVSISTIEHIGLGFYGDRRYEDAGIWRQAISEMKHVSRDKLLLTCPVEFEKKWFIRRLDADEVLDAIADPEFEIIEAQVFVGKYHFSPVTKTLCVYARRRGCEGLLKRR